MQTGEPEIDKGNYYCILSRTYSILGAYDKAIDAAQKSLSFDPKLLLAKISLADAKHLAGFEKEAHEIYSQLMDKIDINTSFNSSNEALANMLSIEGKGLRSPVLAIALLESGSYPEAAWDWAEDEFYYSPYFRCQYAYWIIRQKKDVMKAFAKLLAVVKDMAWVKEAALNTMELFNVLDPNGGKGLLVEDRVKLVKLIEMNNWTSDGLYKITI